MNFKRKDANIGQGFQIAPMIDVIFLLLSFFIASQVFSQWETEINVTLPTARSGDIPQRLPGEIIVNITSGGEYVVNNQLLTEDQLSGLLARIVEIFPGQPVLIRTDRNALYHHVIAVLDLCRQRDIWNISFATSPSEE